jgi:hypothetical protein
VDRDGDEGRSPSRAISSARLLGAQQRVGIRVREIGEEEEVPAAGDRTPAVREVVEASD